MGAQWILEFYISTFFLKSYIISSFIFFVWTSRVPRDVENLGKWTVLATKDMNGRKNSRMSFPVKAILLPVGGQVTTTVTPERRTYIATNSCMEVSMVV